MTGDVETMATPTAKEIKDWMLLYLGDLLGMDPGEIDTATSFEAYGLDSTAAAGMSGDLGDWLGIKLDASLAAEFTTVDALTAHLVEHLGGEGQ
jgi:acyl carrier protein